jgi:hypothetical protein
MKNISMLISILPLFILFSCKQLSISENEKKAISEISDLYGGACTYSININSSTKYGKRAFFEIEISNSDFFNENTMWTEMHAANFAYIFFTHTKKDERKYNSIKSTITYIDGRKVSFEYSPDTLDIVNKKMSFVYKIIDILKSKDYKKLSYLLRSGFLLPTSEKVKFMNYIKSADSTFGTIQTFTPTGFRFNSIRNGNQFLHISGNVKRRNQDTQFSVDINPDSAEDELYLLDYNY